jgi:hypothetical protein
MVGHHDRMGLGDDALSKSLERLASYPRLQPGGAGLFYCFAAD